ncbi:ribulose-phosphate 3-epimerase, partial [Dehalococcoidia bacterium]|nr:ribulose-phosphate 3-epimerase [Dehalococcoidia bacterium]
IEEYLHLLDQVLVMTVHPGLPGQKFLDTSPQKISSVRKSIEEKCLNTELEVDGGINAETISVAAQAGASVLVAGSAIYDHPAGINNAMKSLRKKLDSF